MSESAGGCAYEYWHVLCEMTVSVEEIEEKLFLENNFCNLELKKQLWKAMVFNLWSMVDKIHIKWDHLLQSKLS